MHAELSRRWLTIDEAAAYTGYAVSTLYHKVQQRLVPVIRKHGRLRFDIRDLDEWLERDRIPSCDEF